MSPRMVGATLEERITARHEVDENGALDDLIAWALENGCTRDDTPLAPKEGK